MPPALNSGTQCDPSWLDVSNTGATGVSEARLRGLERSLAVSCFCRFMCCDTVADVFRCWQSAVERAESLVSLSEFLHADKELSTQVESALIDLRRSF